MPHARVLFISPQPFLANRGSPLRVKSEVDALLSAGYQVDLLAFPFGTYYERENLKILRSANPFNLDSPEVGPSYQKFILDIFLFFSACRHVFTKKYQAIHGVEEAGFIAALLGFLFRIPYVMDMHSLLPDQLKYSNFIRNNFLLRSIESIYRTCLRTSSGVVSVCKEVEEYVDEHAPEVPCETLEDFPTEASTQVSQNDVDQFLKQYQLEDSFVFLYTGNFSSYQGIDLLLEAFSELKSKADISETNDTIKLVLVGEASEELQNLYATKAKELGIGASTIFTGELPSSKMGSIMAAADVLVSPRTKGGNTPLKVYCYMASEVPIVATSISSHTQVLNPTNSYLSEPDPVSLGNTLLLAYNEKKADNSSKRTIEARKLIDTRFNSQVFGQAMDRLYQQVIGSQ